MHELRYAFRQLLRSPSFTLLAVITLGLGIGLNTAMFSVLNEVLLKKLPFRDSDRIVSIERTSPQNPALGVAPADFLDLQREESRLGQIAGYRPADASLSEPGHPAEMVYQCRVTTNVFSLLGVAPQLGRSFRADEQTWGKDQVVILSDRCWKNRFGGLPGVIGRTIRLDGVPHEVIGVMPPEFNDWRWLGYVDFFRPLAFDNATAANRRSTVIRIIGRLGTGVTLDDARHYIANFGSRRTADFPDVNAGSVWRAVPLDESVTSGGIRTIVPMMIGLSGFVLLIACSNLANLLLARTIARAREFALRAALGASRGQLLRPLAAESLLLALAGGAIAVLVSRWTTVWFTFRSADDTGQGVTFTLDWRVLAWTFGTSVATALAFGLAPALYAMGLNLNNTLKSGARGSSGGPAQHRFRQALIVGQFALAMVLLAGAGLFIRGLDELNHRRAGWDSERLVTGTVLLPSAGYAENDKIAAFHRATIERIESLPGVAAASLSSYMPFVGWADARKYVVEGREAPRRGQEPTALVNTVTPHYFDTVGTRLTAGHAFAANDNAAAPKVYIINQAMAHGLFGAANPIGRRIAPMGDGPRSWGEIVGVAADVKSDMPDEVVTAYQLYQPLEQEPRLRTVICVRASGLAPAMLLDGVRNVMTQLDPDLPIRNLWTADVTVRRRNYQLAVLRDILFTFALLGLGLATLGVYGVIARTMAQRTVEFAIRLALGATPADINGLVLVTGAKLALLGSAIGLIGSFGVYQVLAAGFPNMHLQSPPVLILVLLLLVLVALIACWLPARRAARVDTIVALRAE